MPTAPTPSAGLRRILAERTSVPVPLAAELLSISRQNAYIRVRNGTIPAVRLGKRWIVLTAELRRHPTSPSHERIPVKDGYAPHDARPYDADHVAPARLRQREGTDRADRPRARRVAAGGR